MSFYVQSAATAQRLLKKYGQAVPIRKFTEGDFDPIAGTATETFKRSETLVAISVPFSSNNAEGLSDDLKEALALGRLRKLICGIKNAAGENLKYAPEPGCVVDLENDNFYIRGVTPLSPGGIPVLYTLIGEKGSLSTADANAEEVSE